MKTILLTGFEPFGGSQVNPSRQIALTLNGRELADCEIFSQVLPVDRVGGPEKLKQAIDESQPAAIVCLGEASQRAFVSVERLAINLMDYRIPDNLGEQVSDLSIVPDGPAAYFSTLPVREIYQSLLSAGIPAELSLSAGAYLCNQVFYFGQHYLSQHKLVIPMGFIHLPSLPEQAALATRPYPSMSLETSLRAIEIAIDVLVKQL